MLHDQPVDDRRDRSFAPAAADRARARASPKWHVGQRIEGRELLALRPGRQAAGRSVVATLLCASARSAGRRRLGQRRARRCSPSDPPPSSLAAAAIVRGRLGFGRCRSAAASRRTGRIRRGRLLAAVFASAPTRGVFSSLTPRGASWAGSRSIGGRGAAEGCGLGLRRRLRLFGDDLDRNSCAGGAALGPQATPISSGPRIAACRRNAVAKRDPRLVPGERGARARRFDALGREARNAAAPPSNSFATVIVRSIAGATSIIISAGASAATSRRPFSGRKRAPLFPAPLAPDQEQIAGDDDSRPDQRRGGRPVAERQRADHDHPDQLRVGEGAIADAGARWWAKIMNQWPSAPHSPISPITAQTCPHSPACSRTTARAESSATTPVIGVQASVVSGKSRPASARVVSRKRRCRPRRRSPPGRSAERRRSRPGGDQHAEEADPDRRRPRPADPLAKPRAGEQRDEQRAQKRDRRGLGELEFLSARKLKTVEPNSMSERKICNPGALDASTPGRDSGRAAIRLKTAAPT